jgi:thiamine-phosphate pyrophosphorylase
MVTDRHRLAPDADDRRALDRLLKLVEAAAHAGIDLIQIRERDLEARALLKLAEQCVAAARATPAKIVVNDRLDVALAAGADGVHLRSDSFNAPDVRRVVPLGFLAGRSVHGAGEAGEIARRGGIDYLIYGTVFSSASKPEGHALTDLDELRRACAAAPVPVLAIGGIDVDRAEAVAKAGAAGVAGIGLFIPPTGVPFDRHLEQTVATLRRAFDTCGAVP